MLALLRTWEENLRVRQIAWFVIAALILVYAIGYRSVDIKNKVEKEPLESNCEATARELASEVLKRLLEEFAIQPEAQKLYLDGYSEYFCACLKDKSKEGESESLDENQSAELIRVCSSEAGKRAGEIVSANAPKTEGSSDQSK